MSVWRVCGGWCGAREFEQKHESVKSYVHSFTHTFTQDLHGQTGTDQAHERKDPAAHCEEPCVNGEPGVSMNLQVSKVFMRLRRHASGARGAPGRKRAVLVLIPNDDRLH